MPHTYNQAVAAEIRAELGRRRLTQNDLALSCGRSTHYISRRMTGQVPFTTDELESIAKALGLSLTELTNPPSRSWSAA